MGQLEPVVLPQLQYGVAKWGGGLIFARGSLRLSPCLTAAFESGTMWLTARPAQWQDSHGASLLSKAAARGRVGEQAECNCSPPLHHAKISSPSLQLCWSHQTLPGAEWAQVSQGLCLLWSGGAAEAVSTQALGPPPSPGGVGLRLDQGQCRETARVDAGLQGGRCQHWAMTPGMGEEVATRVQRALAPIPAQASLSLPRPLPLQTFSRGGHVHMYAHAQSPQFFFSLCLCVDWQTVDRHTADWKWPAYCGLAVTPFLYSV